MFVVLGTIRISSSPEEDRAWADGQFRYRAGHHDSRRRKNGEMGKWGNREFREMWERRKKTESQGDDGPFYRAMDRF
jgi:hypothetical protein